MFTFVTTVKARLGNGDLRAVTVVESKALTWEQAERQALAKADLTVRDGFGQIVESPELIWNTVRKFTVEV
jgi:hypothetical protein